MQTYGRVHTFVPWVIKEVMSIQNTTGIALIPCSPCSINNCSVLVNLRKQALVMKSRDIRLEGQILCHCSSFCYDLVFGSWLFAHVNIHPFEEREHAGKIGKKLHVNTWSRLLLTGYMDNMSWTWSIDGTFPPTSELWIDSVERRWPSFS